MRVIGTLLVGTLCVIHAAGTLVLRTQTEPKEARSRVREPAPVRSANPDQSGVVADSLVNPLQDGNREEITTMKDLFVEVRNTVLSDMEKEGHPVTPKIKHFIESDQVKTASRNITREHWTRWLKAIIITHEVLRTLSSHHTITPDISKFARSAQTQKDLRKHFDLLTADGWKLWEAKNWLTSKIRTHIKRKAFRTVFEKFDDKELKGKWDSIGEPLFKLLIVQSPDLPMDRITIKNWINFMFVCHPEKIQALSCS